jgi:hypothetical protein
MKKVKTIEQKQFILEVARDILIANLSAYVVSHGKVGDLKQIDQVTKLVETAYDDIGA